MPPTAASSLTTMSLPMPSVVAGPASLAGQRFWSGGRLLCLSEAALGFVAAYVLLTLSANLFRPGEVLVLAAGLSLASGLFSGALGLYQMRTLLRPGSVLSGTAITTFGLTAFLAIAFDLLAPEKIRSGAWTYAVQTLLLFTLLILGLRLGFSLFARRGGFRRRVAVLRGEDMLPMGAEDGAYEFVPLAAGPGNVPVRDLRAWALVADASALSATLRASCSQAGTRVLSVAEFQEMRLGRVDVHALQEDWLQTLDTIRQDRVAAIVRRGFDIVASLALLLFTLPLLLLIALAIRLESRGPVFYRQERVGKDGRVFTLFKLRSMVVDAEAGGAPLWATRRDPRVTRVGRFIRLTRIDEIPQVLNVLRGDMAFVGPRPERPAFVEQLGQVIPHYHDRAVVKPGITGWAQVNYPYGASVEDARMKLAYDLYYIRRRSLLLDLRIVLATIRVVLLQVGAR